jgi:hypothetical protein
MHALNNQPFTNTLLRGIFCLGVFAFSDSVRAQDTLFVVRGNWTQIPEAPESLRLVAAPEWTEQNTVLEAAANTSWPLVVVNLDSLEHEFTVLAAETESVLLEPADTVNLMVPALEMGTYRYGLTDGQGVGLGAQGMIQIGLANQGTPLFHWNLCDWETAAMAEWSAGESPSEGPYVPNYFTINERVFPNTLEDENAVVVSAVGDTSWISIANHGRMDHVLHFHGFHVTILSSNMQPERIGWSKDTVPIKQGEGMTVQLVTDQAGVYPVHDHNLIAVTNAGFYPGGMLTQIQVMP